MEKARKEEKETEFPIPISQNLISSLRGKDEKKGENIGAKKDFDIILEHLF